MWTDRTVTDAQAFAERYAERSRTTVARLLDIGRRVVTCDCGDPLCEGFVMVSAESIEDDLLFYGADHRRYEVMDVRVPEAEEQTDGT